MNSNWPRWIFASCSKHFDTGSYHLYVTGDDRKTEDLMYWAEFRMDGPYIKEISRNYYKLYVEINILCVVQQSSDAHLIHKMVGHYANLFTQIPVYKYGTPGDDTLLGCLTMEKGKDLIQISHFGQIDTGTSLLQATVEGHYYMHLEGD